MVKLNKIYTKTGDKGETGLTGGARVKKYCIRVETYGTVDEANSAIGIARLYTQGAHDAMLLRIQHDLFDVGADLSTPLKDNEKENDALRILPKQVSRLEQEMDALNASIPPLNSFILPGGTKAASYLHLARTIVRKAERDAFKLAAEEAINPHALEYLNRLSDHLFVLARAVNNNGADDVLWKAGATR